MNCETARDLLSAYHDNELSPETAERLSQHLADCRVCREELTGFRSLSRLTVSLPEPSAPPSWSAVEEQLTGQPSQPLAVQVTGPEKSSRQRRGIAIALSLVAMLAVGLFWFLNGEESDEPGESHDHGKHLAVNFDRYLTLFPDQPQKAQQVLVSHYRGKAVTIEQAAARLPYRPLAAAGPPPGYELDAAYLLDMPCCQCLQAIYGDSAGGQLALFEHEADQPIWFGKRPALTAECAGMNCRIVQFDSRLAFTCPLGPRYATVIGARDLEEVIRIVEYYQLQNNQVSLRPRPTLH